MPFIILKNKKMGFYLSLTGFFNVVILFLLEQGLLQQDRDPSMRRDLLWYIAVGAYRVSDWGAAKEYADALLALEPRNRQALGLRECIDAKRHTDGLIGLGVVSAAVGLVAIGLTALLRRR